MSHHQAQTKNAVIEELWRSKDIERAIGKMQPDYIRDDLRAEMFARLCELPEDRILHMHDGGFLVYYMVRMMLIMVKSKRSTFYKKFRQDVLEVPEHITEQADAIVQEFPDNFFRAFDDLHFVEQEVFKIYADSSSVSEVSEKTMIPVSTIEGIIRRGRAKMAISTNTKYTHMEIEVNVPLRIRVTKILDNTDQIMDMMDSYATHLSRKISEVNIQDNISQIVNAAKCYPKVVTIKKY